MSVVDQKGMDDIPLVEAKEVAASKVLSGSESIRPDETREGLIKKIKDFAVSHPSILYKGVPLALATYACYPLLISFWYLIPWIWSGYVVWSMIPTSTLTVIWMGLRAYKALV